MSEWKEYRVRKPKFSLHRRMCEGLLAPLQKATKRQLKIALQQCKVMSQTNVWWLPYRLREELGMLIQEELDRREVHGRRSHSCGKGCTP